MASSTALDIDRRYIEKALNQIKRDRDVPVERRSKKYCLVEDKRHYPPKYVLSQAHYHKTGKALKGFKGGPQTNTPLEKARYTIVPCDSQVECQNWLTTAKH